MTAILFKSCENLNDEKNHPSVYSIISSCDFQCYGNAHNSSPRTTIVVVPLRVVWRKFSLKFRTIFFVTLMVHKNLSVDLLTFFFTQNSQIYVDIIIAHVYCAIFCKKVTFCPNWIYHNGPHLFLPYLS